MDREEARLKAALEQAAPEVDETGALQSVVQKGRGIKRRRRVYRTLTSVAAIAIVAIAAFGAYSLLHRGNPVEMQFGSPGDSTVTSVAGGGDTSTSEPGDATSISQPDDSTSATQPAEASSTSVTDAATSTSEPAGTTSSSQAATTTPAPGTVALYKNVAYGFTVTLPHAWHGFTIVALTWDGYLDESSGGGAGQAPIHGPEILIRNPEWSEADPHQDIPIMVFTKEQWAQIQQAKLDVSAAPIPPTELGHNSTYVFALPPRYNYAFPTGYKDVEEILKGHPLQAFDLGTGDYEITKKDIGTTFSYSVTTRFSVILDGTTHPAADTRAIPSKLLGKVSNLPEVTPPLEVVRFEALAPGTCTINNGDFSVIVVVLDAVQ
jgi:hypothetical protein